MARDEYDHLRESADEAARLRGLVDTDAEAANLAALLERAKAQGWGVPDAGQPSRRYGTAASYYRAPDLDAALDRAARLRAERLGVKLERSGPGYFAYRDGGEERAIHRPTREEALAALLDREAEEADA